MLRIKAYDKKDFKFIVRHVVTYVDEVKGITF